MGGFERTAVRSVELFVEGKTTNPGQAWDMAAKEFQVSCSTQTKVCPRCAFLGLCEEGVVKDIPKGYYTSSVKDKEYPVVAVKELKTNPGLAYNKSALWRKATKGRQKAHNQQMDVVVGLWKNGLITA